MYQIKQMKIVGGHLTLKEIQEDVRHSSDKPELVAIAEPASNRPKKRSQRAAPADPNATPADPAAAADRNGGAPVAITAPYTPTTDPNAIMQDKMHLTKCCHLMTMVLDQVPTVLCQQ